MGCAQKWLILLSSVCLVVSCERKSSLSSTEKERVINEVTEMLTAYHEAIKKNGLSAEFEFLDQSENFFWIPPGYHLALNYDSVESILTQNALSLTKVNFEWKSLTIIPLTADLANFHGIVSGNILDTAGVLTEISMMESGTVIKRTSGWKLHNGQSALLINSMSQSN